MCKETGLDSSEWSTQKLIAIASQYNSVLDVGCGRGGLLTRIKADKRVGIDACAKGFSHYAHDHPEIEYIEGDVKNILFEFGKNAFECIVGMDIVEHLHTVSAVQFLKDCEKVAEKCILFFIPTGFHIQTEDARGIGNDYYQTHRSVWYPQDMLDLGYTVTFYDSWYKKDIVHKGKGAMWCVKRLD